MFDFITSDPHYGHKNIIGFCDRPFKDVNEMNVELVNRYNKVVGPNDSVLWVGDCTMGMKFSLFKSTIMDNLHGRKFLVRGNHDPKTQKCLDWGFEGVADELWLDLEGTPALVSHYPPKGAKDSHRDADTRYWDRRPEARQGVAFVHGHTHEAEATFRGEKRIHIGVDAWDYTPARISDVVELAHEMVKP